jgi:hypothetical protein
MIMELSTLLCNHEDYQLPINKNIPNYWDKFLSFIIICCNVHEVISVSLVETYFCEIITFMRSRDSVVGIATGYGLDDQGVGVRVPVGQEFSILHVVQTGFGVHPTSYPMGTGGSFPGGKAAGAWSWPLTSSYFRGQENVDLYIHSPIRRHGVVLN